MTVDTIIEYCKAVNLNFVQKPDNILTFDNPDMMFISEQNELIGCIWTSVTEQRNENYLIRRLFQIRNSYPEEMKLIVLNGETIKSSDVLKRYCHFASSSDDDIHLLNNVIEESKRNKDIISITKKFRLSQIERSNTILSRQQEFINYEKSDEVLVLSWIKDKSIYSKKVFATNQGYMVDLTSAKDNQILTVLNFMDFDTRQKYIEYNRYYYGVPRCGLVRGHISDTQRYKLSLRYSLLGVKCMFEG